MKSLNRHAVLATSLLASCQFINAQNIDWGNWNNSGTGIYSNGGSITISGVVNGSATAGNNETASPHVNVDPAFPYLNAPGAGEYGFFHNVAATTSDWSVRIDLANFSLNSSTVIGFSNLDGRDLDGTVTYANIAFLDGLGQAVSVSSATFVGSFDYSWTGTTWDAQSNFDKSTGVWSVAADSGNAHPAGTYSAAVANAFFLTNLPTNIKSIVYTKSGQTNYTYDSTLFYAGNAVPEPSAVFLASIAGLGLIARRRRD